jgi:hypothetical protein
MAKIPPYVVVAMALPPIRGPKIPVVVVGKNLKVANARAVQVRRLLNGPRSG